MNYSKILTLSALLLIPAHLNSMDSSSKLSSSDISVSHLNPDIEMGLIKHKNQKAAKRHPLE